RRCVRSALRAAVALCHALLAAGDRRAALRTLKECLPLAESCGFRRSFLDAAPEVRAMLTDVLDQTPRGDEARYHYLVQLGAAGEGSDLALPSSGAEALSARELEILALAAQGLQNGDIARSLYLAQSTVKWYWQRIFDKLAVRRRADALRQARERQWVR
ncbi:MAG: LuxR C-terminal-related transcriptional regulator, partial [Gammaproteobacteria bacterium]|nr:LuxR C-terminal-related transcriptional regulator [Gammaproteobacteria bacterium]